jgi:hypothetical protein
MATINNSASNRVSIAYTPPSVNNSTSASVSFDAGEEALYRKNFTKLTQLYEASANKITDFLTKTQIEHFFYYRLQPTQQDALIVEWLIDKVGNEIPKDCFEDALNKMAKSAEGLPIVKILLEKKRDAISADSLTTAFTEISKLGVEKGAELMELLIEKSGDNISYVDAFTHAGRLGLNGLPLMRFLMEKPEVTISSTCISAVCKDAAGLGIEKGLPILQLLLNKAGSDFDGAFGVAIRQREKGFPMMQWLVENAKDKMSCYSVSSAFENLVWEKDILSTLSLLLEHCSSRVAQKSLDSAFSSALYRGDKEGFEIVKLIWEKTKESNRHHVYPEYIPRLLDHGIKKGELYTQILDWLLEQAAQLQGTRAHLNFTRGIFFYPDEIWQAERINSHLRTKGFEWKEVKNFAPNLSLDATANPLFSENSPAGLSFFEEICEKIPDKLSAYSFRWAFLKAAANGAAGHALMQRLLANVPQKLSSWSIQRAKSLAEKHGHIETALWIEELKKPHYAETQNSEPMDEDDIKLALASCDNPSGYRALGEAPERYGWKPLTQEELDLMIPDSALETVSKEDPFKGSGIVLVEDGIEKIALGEIRKSEAELFRKLYMRIKHGHTALKITGDDLFQEKILEIIRKLISRPSGRWALLFVCRFKKPLGVVETKTRGTCFDEKMHVMDVNVTTPLSVYTRDDAGTKVLIPHPQDVIFFHEITHAIHYAVNDQLSAILEAMPSSDPEYDNLEEQAAIAGGDKKCEAFALNENVYNFECGLPQRYGHRGWNL